MSSFSKVDLLYALLFVGKNFYVFQYTYYALSYALMIKNLLSEQSSSSKNKAFSKVEKDRIDLDWVYVSSDNEESETLLIPMISNPTGK
jgi:hypothetical protein